MQEKEKRREELKRLKNLKKREILDKIEKLKDVTGDMAVGFTEQDVEGDFNEHEYDEMMKVICHFSVVIFMRLSFLNPCLHRSWLILYLLLTAISIIYEFCKDCHVHV